MPLPIQLSKTALARYGKLTLLQTLRVAALLAGLLYIFQDKLILHPSHMPPLRPDAHAPAEAGVTNWFVGGQFVGKVYSPQTAPVGTIVYYHGNAGSVNERAPVAQGLTNQGFRVVLVEYPGFGSREGKATLTTALDASQKAADWAIQSWSGSIYVAGESLGAGVAAQVAKEHRSNTKGLLLFTPWNSFDGLVDQKLLGLPVHWLLKVSMETVEALKPYPGSITIVGAQRDELIPVQHAKQLAKSLPHSAYVELEFASHNDWPGYMTDSKWQLVTSKLRATPTPRR